RWRYPQVARLLLDGFFDDLPGDAELAEAIGRARVEVFQRLQPTLSTLAALDVYSGMRAGIALLPDGGTLADALRLIAAPAVLTPALLRAKRGDKAVAPD
ncbi:MAG: citrate synthase/methylcitrate synthase, partial [Mesorhizobium sp.]